eukprot:gene1974-2297_t
MGGRGSFGDSPLILGPNGGPMGRPGGQTGSPGRLIMPGSPGQFSQGQGRQQRPPIGLSDDAPSSGGGSLPTANKYRPPPGFMNETVQDPAMVATDPQEMLNKLRANGGVWHSLAKYLPVLYAKGFDTNTIAEITGVNPVDQNRWVVAGTVYDSIASTGQVEQAHLSYFDLGGDALLYHFRFLPAERRAAAASYIVAKQLDEPVMVDTAAVPASPEELDANGFYLVADSRTGQLDLIEGVRIAADPAAAAPIAAVSSAVHAESQGRNYVMFPIHVRRGTIRHRGLLESGKVDVDGSVHVGYFYAVLNLGTPSQSFDVIVDTGSTITYVPCNDCERCGHHNDQPYNPSSSRTSKWVHCEDPECHLQPSLFACRRRSSYKADQCSYSISYAEQSSSEGRLVKDVFTFPNNITKVGVTFGCVNSETGEIFRQKPDGLVGMGNSKAAFHSQVRQGFIEESC